MKPAVGTLVRVGITMLAAAVAYVIGWQLWQYYVGQPWTRDGRVRADVVGVAADVSGLVSEVLVRDNQPVRRGDTLFRIDPARFELALRQAEAVVASRRANLDEKVREANRYGQLSDVSVSRERQEQATAAVQQAMADHQQAVADRDVAKLNLDRAQVTAPVDGTVTNLELRPGEYLAAGRAVVAVVDAASLRVDGYFEETKLPRIHVGNPVTVHLMGESAAIRGHVESIAAGIEDRELAASASLLANVNPTFSWVRLAQRIPVRIALDDVPKSVRLVAGRTATVVVTP